MTESATASTGEDGSISEKTRTGIRTLKRYLGEEKGALTLERIHERLRNETVNLTRDEADTLIESSAVTTSTTPEGETQITAIDVYDSTKPRQRLDPFAEQVDGMEGEYGGIDVKFEAVSENAPSAETMPETTADVTTDTLTDLSEVGNARANALRDAGFKSYTAIQSASVEELTGTDGVQEKAAEKIRQSADNRCDPVAQVAAAAFSRGYSKQDDESAVAQVQLARKVDIPAGEPIADSEAEIKENEDLYFHGLPILEDIDHPFIKSVGEVEPFKRRKRDTGNEAVADIASLLAQGRPVGLEGYPGVGKDTLLEYICARTNSPLLRIPADGTMVSQELFGVRGTDGNGEVVWEPGPVPKAVEYGWKIAIDDFNALDPGVALALNRLLEDNGHLYVKGQNKVIEPHPRFGFIATKNPEEPSFKGTNEQNEALDSRITWQWIPYLGVQEEAELVDAKVNNSHRVFTQEQVLELVQMAGTFRKGVEANESIPRLSTRHLLEAAALARTASSKSGAIKEVVRGACGPRDNLKSAIKKVDDLTTFD